MAFTILLHPEANKILLGYDKLLQKRLKSEIRKLVSSPEMSNFLKGTDFRYIRIGDYRVIYEVSIEDSKIIILFIGHRNHVYSRFMNWFKK